MEKNEQKIIELALNGYSNQEIANKLLINVRFVDKTISDLNNPKEGIYNQDIYYKIIMEKSLHNINVIDKDLLDEIIKMIFKGYMTIEIAVMLNLHRQQMEQILNSLKNNINSYYDNQTKTKIFAKLSQNNNLKSHVKYRRILQLEKNYPGLKLEDYGYDVCFYRSWQKYHQVVYDFLNNGLDVFTLSYKYNFSPSTIRNILTGKDPGQFIEYNYQSETVQKIKELYCQNKKTNNNDNLLPSTDKQDLIKIEKIVRNGRFWILFLLTFRISYQDLARMFKITNVKRLRNDLLQKADELNTSYRKALLYLEANYNSENYNQALNFYKEYLQAKKTNPEKAKEMLKTIDDQEFIKLLRSSKKLSQMTEEEHRLIADYWVKYALCSRAFPYHYETLYKYCLPYHEEELKKIINFNRETSSLYYRRYKRG